MSDGQLKAEGVLSGSGCIGVLAVIACGVLMLEGLIEGSKVWLLVSFGLGAIAGALLGFVIPRLFRPIGRTVSFLLQLFS